MVSTLLIIAAAVTVVFIMKTKALLLVCAGLILLALNNPRGKTAGLTPSLRLRFCGRGSIALSGAISALVMLLVFYLTGLIYFLLPQSEGSVWYSPGRLVMAMGVFALVGAIAGLLRRRVRQRWPYTVMDVGKTPGFYVDELMLPFLLAPLLWGALIFAELQWFNLISLLIYGYPLVGLLTLPFYGLWAWIHSRVIGWIGVPNKQQQMEFDAYEVMVGDWQIRWFGVLDVSVDFRHNRYILKGVLPL